MSEMTAKEMDELLDHHLAAEMRGDVEATLATFSPDIEHEMVGPGILKGIDAVRPRYEGLFRDVESLSYKTLHRVHGPGFVVDDMLLRVKVLGTMMGIPGNGRIIEFRMLHRFKMHGGKITRETAWLDAAAVLRQLRG
ncbi:nuclear transport factor 2 family protein [Pendulispora albinea]|uniref:Ester cyclase n=1 Tax=Pendulispora albinea TaxID=2741071 RepID=A0ABZ2LSQ4_9BACT